MSVTTTPAKTGSGCGRRPVVRKEKVVKVMCICVWIAFGCIRRFGQHYQAPQAIEDEPGPSPLCGQAPETENGLFVQGQSILRLDVKVRQVLDCLHSGDGVGEAVTVR